MRLITPSTNRIPQSVNMYLLLHEQQVITVRRHFGILLGPSVVTLAGLVAAGSLTSLKLSHDALLITWFVWGLLLLYLLWRVLRWSVDYYVVTSVRMLVIQGLLARDVATIPLANITGIKFRYSVVGCLMGYGQFILESDSRDQAVRVLNFIPYPEQLHLEVLSLLFPSPDDEYGQGDD